MALLLASVAPSFAHVACRVAQVQTNEQDVGGKKDTKGTDYDDE